MLHTDVVRKIEGFVYAKPRSVQEIAEHTGKNWRTADRYVDEIEKEYGTLATRVFRGGTRGALKIVYWASIEKASNSVFQEELEKSIFAGRKKDDFSAFDIYQHIEDRKKNASIKIGESEEQGELESLKDIINGAKKHILIFSGNLSFIQFKNSKIEIFKIIDGALDKGVQIKVICRVDFGGKENIEKLLSLNFKHGKELVEMHHREQPLRAIIVDNVFFNLKEVHLPTGREFELKKKAFLFYNIKDKEWSEWLARIFWKMFSSSIDSRKRLAELDKIKL